MKSISGKNLGKILVKYGWRLNRVKRSHHIYTKEGSDVIAVIPVHGNRDLPMGTLKGILKDIGLTENDII